MELYKKAKLSKQASYALVSASTALKNMALLEMTKQLDTHRQAIMDANAKDIKQAIINKKTTSFIDRLTLDDLRIDDMIDGIMQVIQLEDPSQQVLEEWSNQKLHFKKVSVPIGVIGIIYEARPNVSVDAACLCLKSGNACFLRGSKDTIQTNKVLVQLMQDALASVDMDIHTIQLLEDTSRETAIAFMQCNEFLDLLIPRGSANLIKHCVKFASVPIIETGSGNCHVYVDEYADFTKALQIIVNAKTQRVSVCNACESVLIHQNILPTFLPLLVEALRAHNVVIHACENCVKIEPSLLLADDLDYACEYLDYEISVKGVTSVQEAISHIHTFHTKHSDVIVSEDANTCQTFATLVDSACVYINASSRFSDGNEFGFGAEIGISTQKIHARGPMGLKALTSYKYIIEGDGTIR